MASTADVIEPDNGRWYLQHEATFVVMHKVAAAQLFSASLGRSGTTKAVHIHAELASHVAPMWFWNGKPD